MSPHRQNADLRDLSVVHPTTRRRFPEVFTIGMMLALLLGFWAISAQMDVDAERREAAYLKAERELRSTSAEDVAAAYERGVADARAVMTHEQWVAAICPAHAEGVRR